MVELNRVEVDVLKQALDAWERECGLRAAYTGMVVAAFCPKEHMAEEMAKEKLALKDSELEGRQRKDRAILIRAKLVHAEAKLSEHEEEPNAHC